MTAAKIPICRLSLNAPETKPATVGPKVQPKSPESASIANSAVLALFIVSEALL